VNGQALMPGALKIYRRAAEGAKERKAGLMKRKRKMTKVFTAIFTTDYPDF